MTIYSDDGAWNPVIVDAEVDAILGRYGILSEGLRQKVVREARIRLTGRATRDVARLMAARALGAGWQPPSIAFEPLAYAIPVTRSVQDRVLRWAAQRSDFSAREVQRAFDCFERAQDVRACLNGFVARGEIEVLATARRARTGRLPSPRYKVVRTDTIQSFDAIPDDAPSAAPTRLCAEAPDLPDPDSW
jgi:hypothetical protein